MGQMMVNEETVLPQHKPAVKNHSIIQKPPSQNQPIAVAPGSTAMFTTPHSQHSSLPPQILAPTTSDYVAQPVNIPLGAANSLTGGKLKKRVKRKADPDPSILIKTEIIKKAVLIKHMLHEWKQCAHDSNELYWIGLSSLRNWQKMTTEVVMYCRDNIDNPNKMNTMSWGLNSDIVCPHANLSIDGKARILVPRELKEIVYSYYPGAPIFLKNTQPCITCQNEDMTSRKINKQSAITIKLKEGVKRKADPSLLSNGSNMQQVPVSTQNSGVPADTSNAKPDGGEVAPPQNEPVNGIVQPPVVPNRPIAVAPGSTAMFTTPHSQHSSLPPQILAPTTSYYVAQPVNIPLGAANSLTGGKLKKRVKRKADPDPSILIKTEIIKKAVLIKHMLHEWKQCAHDSNELYWIGLSSLRNWQKMTTEVVMYCRDNIDNPNKMNTMSWGLNSDIVCPHANLSIDGKARILVPRELKEIVYSYYPGAPIFLKNTQPCITCQNEDMTSRKINKQSAITIKLKEGVKRKADPSLLSK